MYAVIVTGGKQYKVSEGDVIFVEKLEAEEGSEYTFSEVLAVSGNDGLVVGKPHGCRRNGQGQCREKRQGQKDLCL